MSIEVGDKVRIQPEAAAAAGVLPGDFTRGWTVLEVHQPLEAARGIRVATAKVQRRQGDGYKWFQLEHLTPDVDLPYEPKPPQKTLAEKELEVLQQDPIRRRWMELLGPPPSTEDFAVEIIKHKREANAEVRKLIQAAQNNPYLPPGEYEVKVDFFPFKSATDGEDQHRIVVNRLEPTHDPKTGENISGNLKTYYMPVGVEELQKAFGGGLYELIIMGPDPMSGRKLAIRKRDKVRIAGKPRLASDIEDRYGDSIDC